MIPLDYMTNFIDSDWKVFTTIFAVIVAVITTFLKWKGIKSNRVLREEYMKSFEQTIINLSSENPSSQLTSAILLRRFFHIDEMRSNKEFLKDEAINVISSLLRTLPTNVFQKTIGDGLAYARDLTEADLQRTNLHDVCLEGKTTKLILNRCDLFMADLSYALIKNVDAEGAYFYHSLLLRTIFKHANLIKADFRNSDLTNSKFEKVKLYEADFTGAINIPNEIKTGLKECIADDGSIRMKYMNVEEVSTSNHEIKGSVFFSIPGCTSIEDNSLILEYKKIIKECGYNVLCYFRDQYPQFGQLNKIRLDIMQSSAMIVFGLKQLKIEKGVYRPGTDEENNFNMKWMHTPWNELEVGLGAMIGLPILLVKDNDINTGIFDSHLSESYITTVNANEKIETIKDSEQFRLWLSKIGNAKFNILANNKELIESITVKEHELWCQERLNNGWSYGPSRNDELKQHPCLLPFNELPVNEKRFMYSKNEKIFNLIDNYLLDQHKFDKS